MEANRINNTAIKLKRLHVNYNINYDNSISLNGAIISNGKILLTIFLPLLIFISIIIFLGILILTAEFDRITLPKIILIVPFLPLILLYYGIKNILRIKKSSKISVKILKGSIELIDKKETKMIILKENIKDIVPYIEENQSDAIGEIYVVDCNNQKYLLLSLLDNKSKYLKDDITYIRNTIKMIIES